MAADVSIPTVDPPPPPANSSKSLSSCADASSLLPRLTLLLHCRRNQIPSKGASFIPPRCVATRKDSVFTAFVSRRCRSYPISCGNLPRNSGQESCRAAFRVVLGDFVLFFCSFRVRLVLSELCDEYPSTLLGDDTGFWVNLRRISVEKKPLLFSETRLKTKEFFGPVVLSLTYSRLFLHHVFYQGDKTFFESSG